MVIVEDVCGKLAKSFTSRWYCLCLTQNHPVRGVFFEIAPSLSAFIELEAELFAFLNLTGDTLFFMAYFMLLLFWVELYQSMNGQVSFFARYRRSIFAVCFVVLAFLIISVTIMFTPIPDVTQIARMNAVVRISGVIISVLFFITAIGFFYCGIKLIRLLRNSVVFSLKKRRIVVKIGIVAALCTICFLVRAGLLLYSVVENPETAAERFNVPPWIMVVYYFLLEVIPTLLMLFLLRKLPKWRKSEYGYEQINSPKV